MDPLDLFDRNLMKSITKKNMQDMCLNTHRLPHSTQKAPQLGGRMADGFVDCNPACSQRQEEEVAPTELGGRMWFVPVDCNPDEQ
jgi:hypothetical protein